MTILGPNLTENELCTIKGNQTEGSAARGASPAVLD
jgi:hypothetical protein